MFHRARQSFMMRSSANVSRSTPQQHCASAPSSSVSAGPCSSYPMNNIGYSRFNQVRWRSSTADAPPTPGKGGLLNRYNMWSQRSPVICITVTSSTLWCLGDLAAQYIEGGTKTPVAESEEERKQMLASSSTGLQRFLPSSLRYLWSKDWFTVEIGANESSISGFCLDARRLVATTVFGSLIAGVGGQMWYKYLDHLVLNVMKLENRGTRFVITKWLIECFFWHPATLFTFWVFVGLTGGGDSLEQIKRQLQSDFMGTLAAEIALYTPVDLLNFSKVPLHLQVVVCNVASFFEAIMLSYLHNLSVQNEKNAGGDVSKH